MLDSTALFILGGLCIAAFVAILIAAILYVTIYIEKSPCDTCRHHQEKLDPEGCFALVGSTGALQKTAMKVTGCKCYECK